MRRLSHYGVLTIPAYRPFLSTQIYRSPNFEKHSYTRSIGDCISNATGACNRQH